MLRKTVKRLCKDTEIEGQFTDHSLRAKTATRGLQKGIPDKFLMDGTAHRDVRPLQKYQRPDQVRLRFQRSSTVVKPCQYPS